MLTPEPKRSEIWLVRLHPTIGDEIGKIRPCVVVSGERVGRLRLRMVVPITDWKDFYGGYIWMTRLDPDAQNGLSKISSADAFQLRSASLQRFVTRVGTLSKDQVDRIEKTIGICVRE